MGMFSWECKGCGIELHEGEQVRLNGCQGEYDGYGRAGGFDLNAGGSEPAAWHEVCYQAAPDKEKLDEEPSNPASNQGFGYALEKFISDPAATKTYEVRAVGSSAKGEKNYLYTHCFINNFGDLIRLPYESHKEVEQRDEWNEKNMNEFPIIVAAKDAEHFDERIAIYESAEYKAAWKELQSRSPFQPQQYPAVGEARNAALTAMAGNPDLNEITIIANTESGKFNGAVEAVKGELR